MASAPNTSSPEGNTIPKMVFSDLFGLQLLKEDFQMDNTGRRIPKRPWKNLSTQSPDQISTINMYEEVFIVVLRIPQYTPEEISVKVIDRYIYVDCKHKEKTVADGSISREYMRRYTIPEEYDPLAVNAFMSSEGILVVGARRLPCGTEKRIPLIKIGSLQAVFDRLLKKQNLQRNDARVVQTEKDQTQEEKTQDKTEDNQPNSPEKKRKV